MALESQHVSEVQIALADDNILWGACEINDDFGEVQTASLRRESDQKEFMKCNGDLLALVLSKFKTVLTLEVLIKEGAALPGIADRIGFPGLNTQGRIMTVEKKWSQDGAQMLSINATQWDVFQSRELATKVIDGEVEYIGPDNLYVDFEGFTFTNRTGGGLVGEAEYQAFNANNPVIELSGFADPNVNDAFAPVDPAHRVAYLNDALLFKNGSDYYCAYDVVSNRLHIFDNFLTIPVDEEEADGLTLGSIFWDRTV